MNRYKMVSPAPPPDAQIASLMNEPKGSASNRYFDDIIPLGECEVQDALLREVKRHRYWKASAFKKMQFERLEMLNCLHYVLESFTEARSTSEAAEALVPGQMLDHATTSFSSPWDVEVQPGKMFADQVRVLEMPGSSTINPCSVCNSEGTYHCFHCRGYGTDKCNFCRGTGMKSGVAHPAVYTHPMVATFPHADLSRGYASSSTAMVRQGGNQAYGLGTPMHFMSKTGVPPPGLGTHDLCYMCHGRGVKECHHCKGGGKKPCTACCGTGSVRNYTKLKVYFKTERSEFFTECEVPEKLLSQVKGKEIFCEEEPYVLPISKYHVEEVNEKSKLFCAQHLQNSMGMCRVIRQRHCLVAIPVCKVYYTLGKTKGTFYVYGNERQCYVPSFPSKCVIL
ncbi:Suppressor of Stomatin mutant Uncoordination [Trichostrongylus colubriformis]|uniref:Suppressor of Stomatin mutant Uncoordination n=1 Tax=Trichostrongylus colubriformis TaxID=6319 RepID=A0AAN8F597_TRICO